MYLFQEGEIKIFAPSFQSQLCYMAAFAITGGYANGVFDEDNYETDPANVEGAWAAGYMALVDNKIHNECDPGSDTRNLEEIRPKKNLKELQEVGTCLEGAMEETGCNVD